MKKAFFLDVETTGLHPWHNDIIQLAAIIEVNGEVKEEFTADIQPFDYDKINEKALEVTGLTVDDIKKFEPPQMVYKRLIEVLEKYINKFDKTDKFTPIGYNVKFDCDFLSGFFKKNEDRYYGSWFNWKTVDPLYQMYTMDYKRKIALPDYKLNTVCQHFGIPIEAHQALSDIRATRELFYVLDDMEA